MAVEAESARRTNVMHGLTSLTQGFNSLISREQSPLSPLARGNSRTGRRKPGTSAEKPEDVQPTQTEQPFSHKIPRKWDGFGRERRSPKIDYQALQGVTSPLFSPKSKSPSKTDVLFGFAQSPKHREHEQSFPRRRKDSVSDLLMDKMTTVQEYPNMDSPTIPGRPPTKTTSPEQSKQLTPISSTRGSLTPRAVATFLATEPNLLTPRAMTSEPNLGKLEEDDRLNSVDPDNGKSIRRASSLLLPRGLAPLFIPSNDECILPAEAYRPSDPESREGAPPRVPPKSPRTLNRKFPQSTKMTPLSNNSSTTTLNLLNSSISSVSTTGDTIAKPWSDPLRSASPRMQHKRLNSTTEKILSPPWSARTAPSRQMRCGMSIDETSSSTPVISIRSGSSTPDSTLGHQRGASEGSVMSRGRPMRRGDMSLQRILQKTTETNGSADETYRDLPTGMSATRALNTIPVDELRNLKRNAESSAVLFGILRESEVSDLSKELQLLNERCEYLHMTYTSLREGRRGLHNRIVTFLNAPRTATFSAENIMKQEDALVELDVSIDGWTVKLEQAQDRRNKVRQKLLEHVAAISILKVPGGSRTHVSGDAPTPPRSPEKGDRSFSNERRDVESIKVYADSGVASLLASIERELGMMEDQGRFES